LAELFLGRKRNFSLSRGEEISSGKLFDKQSVILPFFPLQISDDDRMSLTTAISDEEEGESIHVSPYKVVAAGAAGGVVQTAGGRQLSAGSAAGGVSPNVGSAASFNCTGAVRKAGFLSVKKWLLRKKHQVQTLFGALTARRGRKKPLAKMICQHWRRRTLFASP